MQPRQHAALRGRPLSLFVACLIAAVLAAACGGNSTPPQPASTDSATAALVATEARSAPTPRATPRLTRTPRPTATPTPDATATPRPKPPFEPTSAVVALSTASRAAPSMGAAAVRTLGAGASVDLVDAVYGENWIIGDQGWVPVAHEWESIWYQLADGSYVYRAFVLLAADGSPWTGGDHERYVVVDLGQQMAWAMEGDTPIRAMAITSGEPEFATPVGEFRVQARIESERMTSASAGFSEAEFYDVQRVLYTQYFAAGGFALHLNYWQPAGVFGAYPTSHGCVGLQLPDAQFLWLWGSHGMRVIIRESGGAAPAPTPTPTPEPTPAPTPTPTPTATPTLTPTATATATATPTATAAASATPASSATPVTTATATPTATAATPTSTPGVTPSVTPTPTATATASPTPTPSG